MLSGLRQREGSDETLGGAGGAVMRDRRTGQSAGAALLVGALALTGCSPDRGQAGVPSTDATASASTHASSAAATPTSSPSRSLTAEEQEAVKAATAVVLAYRQTIIDLYSGTRTNLNDLNKYATGDLLDADLRNVQHGLRDGWTAKANGPVVVAEAEVLSADLERRIPQMRLRVCIDLTSIEFDDPEGTHRLGTRGQADYILVGAAGNSTATWRVAGAESRDGDDSC